MTSTKSGRSYLRLLCLLVYLSTFYLALSAALDSVSAWMWMNQAGSVAIDEEMPNELFQTWKNTPSHLQGYKL